MKLKSILIIVSLLIVQFSIAQPKRNVYSVGMGIGNENNMGNFGIWFTNDYKFFFIDWMAVNPRINFFQSTGSTEPVEAFGYRSHSGIFCDLGVSIYPLKGFSFNIGPSFQVGAESYLRMAKWENNEIIQEWYENKSIRRLGAYIDLEYSFPLTSRFMGTVALKSNYYYFYPEFLGVVFKVGF